MTCLKIAMETSSSLMPNTLKLVLKNVLKCSYGDCKNHDLEHGLWFLLSSPGAYYCNVPEQRSIYSLNLGLNRPLKRSSVAWHYHNTPTNCLKQYSTHFITAIIFRVFFLAKCPSGICISFTCRWRKLRGGLYSGPRSSAKETFKERWMTEFLSALTKNLLTQEVSRQIHETGLQRDTGPWASTTPFPLHISTTAVIMYQQTDSKEHTRRLLRRRRLQWQRRLTLTCVGSKVKVHGWCLAGSMVLCVSSRRLPVIWGYGGSKLHLQQTPVDIPSLICVCTLASAETIVTGTTGESDLNNRKFTEV